VLGTEDSLDPSRFSSSRAASDPPALMIRFEALGELQVRLPSSVRRFNLTVRSSSGQDTACAVDKLHYEDQEVVCAGLRADGTVWTATLVDAGVLARVVCGKRNAAHVQGSCGHINAALVDALHPFSSCAPPPPLPPRCPAQTWMTWCWPATASGCPRRAQAPWRCPCSWQCWRWRRRLASSRGQACTTHARSARRPPS
jgi:hypothetical protein